MSDHSAKASFFESMRHFLIQKSASFTMNSSIVSSDLDDEPEGGGGLGLAGLRLQLVIGCGDRSRRGSVRGRERRRVAPENDPTSI